MTSLYDAPEVLEEKIHDLESIQKATFNILEDFAQEGEKLLEMQKAAFNILDDISLERNNMESTQWAALNIMEDFSEEKIKLEVNQKATFNILEDFAQEKENLQLTQLATYNILEDFVEERLMLENLQKSAMNILEDLNQEKINLEIEVNERKKAEDRLENANAELESFSYSVSHDLRAPLRGIDGFSLALLQDYGHLLDEEGKNYLNYVRTCSQQMSELIDDLLNLSRTGRCEIHLEEIDLSSLANKIVNNLKENYQNFNQDFNQECNQECNQERNTEGKKEKKFKIKIAKNLKAIGDFRLLKIALENLLGNAFKFTEKNTEAIIEFNQTIENGKHCFFIRDNGAGFNMEYMDKLFGAFQRLHSPTEFSGTGIGLATVKRIINRLDGCVWAKGKVDKGATFYFTLLH